MKAVLHPRYGLILVDDGATTAPEDTYQFEESDAPEVADGQIAVPGLALVAGVVRRTWTVQAGPGYLIPVGDLFRELTDSELESICTLILSGPEPSRVPTLAFLFRAVAQTELSSIDTRVVAARTAFASLLGADRINYLFRRR